MTAPKWQGESYHSRFHHKQAKSKVAREMRKAARQDALGRSNMLARVSNERWQTVKGKRKGWSDKARKAAAMARGRRGTR